eukprot:3374077-Prymnesium_polylepis.1
MVYRSERRFCSLPRVTMATHDPRTGRSSLGVGRVAAWGGLRCGAGCGVAQKMVRSFLAIGS